MRVLVFGGTKFFGKRLVQRLVERGCDVTVASRKKPDKEGVKYLEIDRNDLSDSIDELTKESWDIIYDQICFDDRGAHQVIKLFEGKVKRYIITSSQYVYPKMESLKESDFQPEVYDFDFNVESKGYAEGKKRAEAIFVKNKSFPTVIVRPSIVFGADDYTNRFQTYVNKIKNEEEIPMDDLSFKTSLVSSEELSEILAWVGLESEFLGILNASFHEVSLSEIVEVLQETIGKKARVKHSYDKDKFNIYDSPYTVSESYSMNINKLLSQGYVFKSKFRDDFQREIELLINFNGNRG